MDQEILKAKLITVPILGTPNFEELFIIETDASNTGHGVVLLQVTNGVERVISYASRVLNDTERNLYNISEKECLGILFAIKKYRCYIEGTKFTVITDHDALKWLREKKNPSDRLARWVFEL